MALQTNFYTAKTDCNATKVIYCVSNQKVSPLSSKLEWDGRLIFFYVGKVGASLWGEVKIDRCDPLHVVSFPGFCFPWKSC